MAPLIPLQKTKPHDNRFNPSPTPSTSPENNATMRHSWKSLPGTKGKSESHFHFRTKSQQNKRLITLCITFFFWREGSSELSLTWKEQPYRNAFRKASLRLRKLPYDLLFGRVKGQPESCVRFTWFDGETNPHWWDSMPKCSFELFLLSLFAILFKFRKRTLTYFLNIHILCFF